MKVELPYVRRRESGIEVKTNAGPVRVLRVSEAEHMARSHGAFAKKWALGGDASDARHAARMAARWAMACLRLR